MISTVSIRAGAAAAQEMQCYHILPTVNRFLQKHVIYSELTPELEKRTLKRILSNLDNSKFFLLEKDVKEITDLTHELFTKLRRLDCGPLLRNQSLLLQRVEERVEFARKYLGGDFKLDQKLNVETDAGRRARPKTTEEANKQVAAQLQLDVANYVAAGIALTAAKKYVLQNWELALKRLRGIKNPDVYAGFLDAFAQILDPHSDFMSPEGYDEFAVQMRLSMDGIGATLQTKNGFTMVTDLVPGGAAELSGQIKRGDKILGVAQADGPLVDVMEMEVREIVKLIRGPAGTKVRLHILRRSKKENQRLMIDLTRAKIKFEEQAASLEYVERQVDGKKRVIGVLRLPSFYHDDRPGGPSATSDLKKLIAQATATKVDAIVLDLASNGGGSLTDGVEVAGLFIANGNILKLSHRGANGKVGYNLIADPDGALEWPGPLVILTNRFTASASEIVSGALKDYHRAVIVGADQTYGKGTLQTIDPLADGLGAAKVTTGFFFTAGGYSTQHRGVRGDIVLPSNTSGDGEKHLQYSLKPEKIATFISDSAQVRPVTESTIAQLRAKSLKRFKFKKDAAKKSASLVNIGKLLQGKDLNGGKDEDSDDTSEPKKVSPEEKKKQYLSRPDINEAINIAADLANSK